MAEQPPRPPIRHVVPAIVLSPGHAKWLERATTDYVRRARADGVYLPDSVREFFDEIAAAARQPEEHFQISTPPHQAVLDACGNGATVDPMNAARAGELLGITSKRVRQLANDGALEGLKTPGGWTFHRTAVEAFGARRGAA